MGKQQRQDNDPDDDEDDEDIEDQEQDDDEEDDGEDAAGKKGDSTSKSKDKTFSESEVESIVRRRLARAKRKIKSEVLREMEADTTKGDGDTDLQNKLNDANKRIADLEELEELAEERYERELDALPEEIRDLAPDDDEPILVKERWLVTKGRPAADKLRARAGDKGDDKGDGERKSRRGNNPKDPPNRKRKDDGDPKQKLREEARRSGAYRTIL